MTRKDYVALAAGLASVRPVDTDGTPYETWQDCRSAVAQVLHADNPRFDWQRFIIATER